MKIVRLMTLSLSSKNSIMMHSKVFKNDSFNASISSYLSTKTFSPEIRPFVLKKPGLSFTQKEASVQLTISISFSKIRVP